MRERFNIWIFTSLLFFWLCSLQSIIGATERTEHAKFHEYHTVVLQAINDDVRILGNSIQDKKSKGLFDDLSTMMEKLPTEIKPTKFTQTKHPWQEFATNASKYPSLVITSNDYFSRSGREHAGVIRDIYYSCFAALDIEVPVKDNPSIDDKCPKPTKNPIPLLTLKQRYCEKLGYDINEANSVADYLVKTLCILNPNK